MSGFPGDTDRHPSRPIQAPSHPIPHAPGQAYRYEQVINICRYRL